YSPPRSSRVAWRQGPQGSKQHLALAAPATRTRTQRPRKYLAIHAAELVVEPNFQILRRHRRSLLLRLEHPPRSAVENHVERPPRLGSRRSLNLRIGISQLRPHLRIRARLGRWHHHHQFAVAHHLLERRAHPHYQCAR